MPVNILCNNCARSKSFASPEVEVLLLSLELDASTSIEDYLLMKTEQNLTLPEWTKKLYPHPLQFFRDNLFFVEGDDPGLKRLMAGPLLNVLASDMLNIAGKKNTLPKNIYTLEPSETRRLHLFAGHDINIVILMRAMGVYDNIAPNYSAALGFELRKKAGRYYVTIIYENSLEEPPQLVSIPYCNGICTLEQFISFVTPLIPEDFEAECQRDFIHRPKNRDNHFRLEPHHIGELDLNSYF